MISSTVAQPDRSAARCSAWPGAMYWVVRWKAGTRRDIRRVYGVYTDLPAEYPWPQLRGDDVRTLRRLRPLGLHSDDTQQALALIQVGLTPGGWSVERWAACLVAGIKVRAWRDFGRNFADAVTRLCQGLPPQRAGSRNDWHRRGDALQAAGRALLG